MDTWLNKEHKGESEDLAFRLNRAKEQSGRTNEIEEKPQKKRAMRVLFVCTGNQCRSPMAKVLMERRLEELGLGDRISVDSAGTLYDPGEPASEGARTAVLKACGKDLLADHRSKHLSEVTPNEYDLILTMGKKHKAGLPTGKTFTIKEYAGIGGDVADPFRRPQEEYDRCCQELKALIDKVIEKL